jgi:hypothetical protein
MGVTAPVAALPGSARMSQSPPARLPVLIIALLATLPVLSLIAGDPSFSAVDTAVVMAATLIALCALELEPARSATTLGVLALVLFVDFALHSNRTYPLLIIASALLWALGAGRITPPLGRRPWPRWTLAAAAFASAVLVLPVTRIASVVGDTLHRNRVAAAAAALVLGLSAPFWYPTTRIRLTAAGRSLALSRAIRAIVNAADAAPFAVTSRLLRLVHRWYSFDPFALSAAGQDSEERANPARRVRLGTPLLIWACVQSAVVLVTVIVGDGWRSWTQQDSFIYTDIARNGPQWPADGGRPTVVMFPGYPMLIRLASPLTSGDLEAAAVSVSVFAGLLLTLVFWSWMTDRGLTGRVRMAGAMALATYPYSFILFGIAYSDALFAALAISAFLLVERERPVVAGLAGAAATLSRPTGLALIGGLLVLQAERVGLIGSRGPLPRLWTSSASEWRRWSRRNLRLERFSGLRPAHAGLLLCVSGVGAYMVFCWREWGDPVAFWSAQEWYGHGDFLAASTWAKEWYINTITSGQWPSITGVRFTASVVNSLFMAGLTLGSLLLVPSISRRFGRGYAVYTGLVFVQTWVGATNFGAAGRYLTAAFPVFAIVGAWLAPRMTIRRIVFTASAAYGVLMLALFMNTPGAPSW